MKEKCGECKDYRQLRGSKTGRCAAWQACGFWTEIEPDKTPLENLEGQNRAAYWLARGMFRYLNESVCFSGQRLL